MLLLFLFHPPEVTLHNKIDATSSVLKRALVHTVQFIQSSCSAHIQQLHKNTQIHLMMRLKVIKYNFIHVQIQI